MFTRRAAQRKRMVPEMVQFCFARRSPTVENRKASIEAVDAPCFYGQWSILGFSPGVLQCRVTRQHEVLRTIEKANALQKRSAFVPTGEPWVRGSHLRLP
jgi:hypothetical protein